MRAVGMAAASMLLPGCIDSHMPAWSKFAEVSSSGWDAADLIVFEPAPYDSTLPPETRYDFDLVLRTSTRNKIRRLPVAIEVEDANGSIESDTVVIWDPDGPKLTSKRTYGVNETKMTLLHGQRLTEGFSITLSPLSDASESRGLLNVGVIMRAEANDSK